MVSTLKGLRLLVVEDEALVAMMIEHMLDDIGCIVVEVAGTVSRGLALAADEALAVDGAILDVNLGGEKVYPVAEALRARHVPFIFSTGYGIDGIAAEFSQVPALAKPYQQAALEVMLASILARPAKH